MDVIEVPPHWTLHHSFTFHFVEGAKEQRNTYTIYNIWYTTSLSYSQCRLHLGVLAGISLHTMPRAVHGCEAVEKQTPYVHEVTEGR